MQNMPTYWKTIAISCKKKHEIGHNDNKLL